MVSPLSSKGNADNFPQPGCGLNLVTLSNSDMRSAALGRVLFSSLQLVPLESGHLEIGWNDWSSASFFGASGMQPSALENPMDSITLTPGRTHNRIRSPRLAASGR